MRPWSPVSKAFHSRDSIRACPDPFNYISKCSEGSPFHYFECCGAKDETLPEREQMPSNAKCCLHFQVPLRDWRLSNPSFPLQNWIIGLTAITCVFIAGLHKLCNSKPSQKK